MQALQELNIKPKNWRDLLTDEPFSRKDIIHIQDPLNLTGRNLEAFDHIKSNLKVIDDEELARQQQDPMQSLKNLSDDAKRALGKLNTEEAARVGEPLCSRPPPPPPPLPLHMGTFLAATFSFSCCQVFRSVRCLHMPSSLASERFSSHPDSLHGHPPGCTALSKGVWSPQPCDWYNEILLHPLPIYEAKRGLLQHLVERCQ